VRCIDCVCLAAVTDARLLRVDAVVVLGSDRGRARHRSDWLVHRQQRSTAWTHQRLLHRGRYAL